MKRGIASFVIAVAGLAVSQAPGVAEPFYPDPLHKDRNRVDQLASERIGKNYACAVVSAPESRPGRALRIYITSRRAIPGAEAIREELEHPENVEVRVIRKRFRAARMERIRQKALRSRPPDAQGIGIGEGKLYYKRCPRVELAILPRGEASAEARAWARHFRSRYGRDRVVIKRWRSIKRAAPGASTPRDL